MILRRSSRPVRRPVLPGNGPTSPIRGAIPDDVLVAAARRGDLYAWESLARKYQGFVFRCAYLATRNPRVSEEATQITFVRAYRSLSSLDDPSRLRPWLMRIVAGVARTTERELAQQRDAKFVEPEYSPRLPADPLAPTAAHRDMTRLENEALGGAFDRLGDVDRTVVAARYALGLSRAEMSTYLGVTEDQVDPRLHTALSRLRTYVAGS